MRTATLQRRVTQLLSDLPAPRRCGTPIDISNRSPVWAASRRSVIWLGLRQRFRASRPAWAAPISRTHPSEEFGLGRPTRVALIQKLEGLRSSRVVALILGDRSGQETRLAPDMLPLMARHLRGLGGVQERIDLVLYTVGGDIMSAFRLVSLVREYCKEFTVIVPFRCQSAGTLIALGADHIVMLPEGQLSPVDPSTNGPYNPLAPNAITVPGAPAATLPVSVEEVMAYLELAKKGAGIEDDNGLVAVFAKLASDVRPVALGQVYRARTQIRMLSKKLMEMHMSGGSKNGGKIDRIVETLTEKLYSHDYLITRVEAKEIGLKVQYPEQAVEAAIYELFQAYESDLQLLQPFNPVAALGQQPQARVVNDRACLETIGRVDTFRTELGLQLSPQGLQAQPLREGWEST